MEHHGEFHSDYGRETQDSVGGEAVAECELYLHLVAVVEERGQGRDGRVDCDALFVIIDT